MRTLIGLFGSSAVHGVSALMIVALVGPTLPPSTIEIDLVEPLAGRETATPERVLAKGKSAANDSLRAKPEGSSKNEQPLRSKSASSVQQPTIQPPPVMPLARVETQVAPMSSASPVEVERPQTGSAGVDKEWEPVFHDVSSSYGGALVKLSHEEGRQPGGSAAGKERDGNAQGGDQPLTVLASPYDGSGHMLPEYDQFYSRIRQRIQEVLTYPAQARRRELTGTVLLEIVLHSDGRIGRVDVLRSSTHQLLDEAAVETVRRAAPFSFLSTLPVRQLVVRIPIVFELTQ